MIAKPLFNIIPKNQIFRRYTVSHITRQRNNFSRRNIANTTIRQYSSLPKTPDLIYIPRIFRWLKTKVQFKYLQRTWDPEFTEGAFIYGASKAVCTVTAIIHEDRQEELDDLLTIPARLKLKHDMKTKLTRLQKSVIKINPEDIKLFIPLNIKFQTQGLDKNCRIGMQLLALKWHKTESGPTKLILVTVKTEFLRNYRKETVPEWIINDFDILECVVLSTSPNNIS
uniref:Uncharacterized protein LOC114331470 n=1 Tax=Diabrotica virgifera virgifera TaxID=50390 RepID=A0A6P7FVA0_DIAVI